MRHILLLLILLTGGGRVLADAPLAYSTIEPQKIVMGQSAIMRITSLGPSMGAFTMPAVQGLDFELLGHANQMEFVNGASFPTSSVVLRVTAQFAGIYKIPAVTPKSQPLILEVVPAAPPAVVRAPPSASQSGNSAVAMPGVSAARAAGLRMTSDGSAFLRLEVPKRDVFVGESVPVDIELGLRAGFVVGVHGLPALTGSQFTLTNLSQEPQHEFRKIDGKPFEVFIWHSVIAAVKPGEYSLSADTPITVKIRTQSKQESALDDLLGDPFLQNLFGAMVKRDITVTSPATDLKVLALPEAGRPADFSGAVGDFKVSSELSTAHAAAGEPLTVRMHVSGSGNFDRVDTSMFKRLDQWKTYPPTSTFKKSDVVGHKGEKLFEQPIIAAQTGPQTLPALTFNYFDPVARRYATAKGAPMEVAISAPLSNSAPLQAATTNLASIKSLVLRSDHAELPRGAAYLTPVYLRLPMMVLSSTLALCLAAGVLLLGNPTSQELGAHAKRHLPRLDAAMRSGDARGFLAIAQSIVRSQLAGQWEVAEDSIPAAMRKEKLGDASPEVQELFLLADEARYAGESPPSVDLARWRGVIRAFVVRRES